VDPMKRVLFLVVAVLLAGTTASAKPRDPAPPEPDFVLSPVGDEPGASGTASIKWEKGDQIEGAPPGEHWYLGDVIVSCRGLTPGATYRIDRHVEWEWWHWNEYGQWVCERGSYVRNVFETTADQKGRLRGGATVYLSPDFNPGTKRDRLLVYRVDPTLGDVLVLLSGWHSFY